jgi:hypothetical protein
MKMHLRILALLASWGTFSVPFAQTVITEFPWSESFDEEQPFTLVNGTAPNRWIWGDAAGNDAPCLHIASDLATGNNYWMGIDPWTGVSALTRVYAYVDLAIPEFHYAIDLYFDLRVGGDNSDNLQVLIMPTDVLPLAGYNPNSLGLGVQNVSSSLHSFPEWQTMHYVLSPAYAGQTIRLAFHWRNDWSGGVQPGAAIDNILVTTSPCIAPFALAIENITTNGVEVSWPEMPAALSFHYELRTSGEPGSGPSGLFLQDTVLTEHILWQGLMPGTPYSLYLRTECDMGFTEWGPATTIVTDPACGSGFFDPSGPNASYGPLEERTYVICPDQPAHAVKVTFTSLGISGGDRLEVYDGPVMTGAPKPALGGSNLEVVSDHYSGCLTFRFESDAQWHGQGWQATVSCGTRPGCTVWGVNVSPEATGSAAVTWHCSGAVMPFVVEYGALGWTPGSYMWPGPGGLVELCDTASTTLHDLIPGAIYELEVRANCIADDEYLDRSPVTRFQMHPACGYPWTDFGGAAQNYPPYEVREQTICPDVPWEAVTIAFSDFRLEPWYDVLYVFDGPDTSSPLFASDNPAPLTTPHFGPGGWWGLTEVPGPFVSTHPSGCITTAFISDHTVEYDGWIAQVDCVVVGMADIDRAATGFTCLPNPVDAGAPLTLRLPASVRFPLLLEVFNTSGELQLSQAVSSVLMGSHVLQLPMLAAGLYAIRASDANGMIMYSRVVIL